MLPAFGVSAVMVHACQRKSPSCFEMVHALQQMVEDNKAATHVMTPADLSRTFGTSSAKSGVGPEQLTAVSAALEALQSSMMSLLSAPSTSAAVSSTEETSDAGAAQ